jgi:hypothetical protein
MDTDSLFVKKAGYERLQAAGLIDDKQLGKLKLEEEGDSIRINGCKDYKFNKKEKIKGVSKGSREVETGKYVSTVWRGLSRFIQTGELDHYKNEVIVKTLSRRYEKGLINTDGYILPYKFENDTNLFLKEVEERKDQIRYMIQQLKEQDQLHNKMKPPEIEIILKLKGLKHDGNGAYKEELSNFKYPYRNFKNGCSIDRATNIINWELGTNYYANDILDLLYDYTSRKTLKAEIKALEEEIAAAGIQDYYKTKGDLPF